MSGAEELKLVLRIKSKKSQNGVLRDVSTKQKIQDFLKRLSPMTGVPDDQMTLLRGFPPKRLAYDADSLLETLGLVNQDTLIVELDSGSSAGGTSVPSTTSTSETASVSEDSLKFLGRPRVNFHEDSTISSRTPSLLGNPTTSSGPREPTSSAPSLPRVKNKLIIDALNSSTMRDLDARPSEDHVPSAPQLSSTVISNSSPDDPADSVPAGMMLRHIVPSDNSCLFTSVTFCLSGLMTVNERDSGATHLRELIAATVASDPDQFTEAMLGKPNQDYVTWILKNESWGGGIELSIMSGFYEIEMSVMDIQSLHISRFGEDKNYSQRILLLYDGIHYDPLFLEPFDGSRILTKFPTSDLTVLDKAMQLGREAKAAHQFTDLSNFALRCSQCNTLLRGQTEAQAHAKQTGHTAFKETK